MKQETYYVVVNGDGKYLSAGIDWSCQEVWYEYQGFDPDCLYDITQASQLAAEYNGTVKEVTITIKD